MKLFNSNLFIAVVLSLFNYSVYGQDVNKKFSLDVGVGNSYITAQSNYSPWGINYRKNYPSGLQINSKFLYLFKNNTSLGLKYNLFSSGANYLFQDNNIAENLTVNYIAPQIGTRYILGSKFSFLYTLGVGYVYYQSSGLKDVKEYNISSNIIGGNVDMSLYYSLSEKISIGFSPSFFTSIYGTKMKKTENNVSSTLSYDKWDKLNLSRVDFSINLRVAF